VRFFRFSRMMWWIVRMGVAGHVTLGQAALNGRKEERAFGDPRVALQDDVEVSQEVLHEPGDAHPVLPAVSLSPFERLPLDR
jgi:hypothetical protein